jgi:mannose-6-phosphate isomerase-like protein (cupin superfamily)
MDRRSSSRRRVLPLLLAIACGGALVLASPAPADAQEAPPAPAKPEGTVAPEGAAKPPARRAPARRPAAPAVTTAVVTVTDGTGDPLPGTEIAVTGPVERHGRTAANGSLNLAGLRAGTYRFRFAREGFITLERDVTIRTTQRETIEAVLTAAEEAPARAAATVDGPPAATSAPADEPRHVPAGEPRSLLVADFVERNFIGGREPRREDEIGCTAAARTALLQLRENTPEEARPDADEVLYVVAGEGTLRLGNRDVKLVSSTVAVVPRGTARAITRRGRNPLILLSVISGPACTAPGEKR